METPAQRILKYMEENGIKQTHIARKIKMKPNVLNAKLHGRSRILAEELELLCWALGKTPSEFLKPRAPVKESA